MSHDPNWLVGGKLSVNELGPTGVVIEVTDDEWDVDVSGRESVLEFYDEYWARFDHPRRYFANESFEIDAGNAKVFMYWHVTQENDGESWLGWGTYEWSFIKTDRHWQIAGVIIDILAMTTLTKGWAGPEKIF